MMMNTVLKKKHAKIKKADILAFLVIWILIMPSSYKIFGGHKNAITLVTSILIIGYLALKKYKPNYFVTMLIIFECEFVLSAIINKTEILPFVRIAIPIIAICYLLSYGINKRPKSYLLILIIVMSYYSSIQLYERLLGHSAGYDSFGNILYFMGSDNQATSYLMCLFVLSMIKIMIYKADLFSIYGIVVPVVIGFYSRCGTAMAAYVIIGLFVITSSVPIINKLIFKISSSKGFFIAYIALSVILLFMPALIGATAIGDIISSITGKTAVTFSNRTYVWAAALSVFAKHPVFGIGYGAEGNGVFALGNYRGAHNQVLQWAVLGGSVSVIIFLIMLYKTMRRTDLIETSKRFYILLALFGYLICMSMENYFNGIHVFVLMCSIFCLIPQYLKEQKEKTQEGYQRNERDKICRIL